MSSTLLKTFRNVLLPAFLVAGCGVGEPIPVNLETAAGPCEYGKQFMSEGMKMVMKDGHVALAPKDGEVQAFYADDGGGIIVEEPTGCLGCH